MFPLFEIVVQGVSKKVGTLGKPKLKPLRILNTKWLKFWFTCYTLKVGSKEYSWVLLAAKEPDNSSTGYG